ncbi:MAG: ADP-ribosylglycohydrolase family protein [Bacteroidota bacterium]
MRPPSYLIICLVVLSCQPPSDSNAIKFPVPTEPMVSTEGWPEGLTREMYYDKVLGLLVGSAIGDAMGAPVEMWSRDYIAVQHGFIDTLVMVRRPGQAEGPWEDNLRPGGTTDDTRWKYLLTQFLLSQQDTTLDDKAFARYILRLYEHELADVREMKTFDPEPLERELLQVQWLQEWAKVAKPYAEDDLQGYSYAVSRFYGGEMSCAGMLYSPLIGARFPAQSDKAYLESYKLGMFDLGYARDLSALCAAYVAEAMDPATTIDRILATTENTDPLRYFNSRLVERIAYRSYTLSKQIAHEVYLLDSTDVPRDFQLPRNFMGSRLDYFRLCEAYKRMEPLLQDIPFHAGEIHMINLVAIAFSKGDFRLAMNFIVNFGRDNDTVAAVAGAILGAYLGFEQLPQEMARGVMSVSKETIGIDLEALAQALTEQQFPAE